MAWRATHTRAHVGCPPHEYTQTLLLENAHERPINAIRLCEGSAHDNIPTESRELFLTSAADGQLLAPPVPLGAPFSTSTPFARHARAAPAGHRVSLFDRPSPLSSVSFPASALLIRQAQTLGRTLRLLCSMLRCTHQQGPQHRRCHIPLPSVHLLRLRGAHFAS